MDFETETNEDGMTFNELLADMALTAEGAAEFDDLELVEEDETTDGEPVTCAMCGWVIEDLDLSEKTSRGLIHFDRQCPKGNEKPAPKARKSPERKLAEAAGIVKPESAPKSRQSGSHAQCDHPATKSARAACRRAKNAGK